MRGPEPQRAGKAVAACVPQLPGPATEIEIRGRRVDDRPGDVVVPAVGIVPVDDDRRVLPHGQFLQGVDDLHEESLLRQRIAVAGMSVLEGRRLDEGHRRQIAGFERIVEVGDVVLMVRLVGLADHGDRGRAQMMRVARRGVVHEGLVMRRIVGDLARECRREGCPYCRRRRWDWARRGGPNGRSRRPPASGGRRSSPPPRSARNRPGTSPS